MTPTDTDARGAGLLPCPFCGNAPDISGGMANDHTRASAKVPTAFCECSNCGCSRGHIGDPGETMDQAKAQCAAAWNRRAEGVVLSMILPCPRCGELHVDAPEPDKGWTNPPHRSHLCHYCGLVWRPADVTTNGVDAIATGGKDDNWTPGSRQPAERPDARGECKTCGGASRVPYPKVGRRCPDCDDDKNATHA